MTFMTSSIFKAILGPPGVGKSTMIRQELARNPRYGIKTASTGIAAVNLQDESGSAVTINSALGFYDTKDLLYKVVGGALRNQLDKIAERYDGIILDECSMVEAAALTLIHKAIVEYNSFSANSLSLTVVGDFGQLPPVEGKPAFTSKCWGEFDITYLTEVKRQTDPEFIQALQHIRMGQPELAADWFESNIGFDNSIDNNFPGSTFFSRNGDVDAYNKMAMAKLRTSSRSYQSLRVGQQRSEWRNIPDSLELKLDCLVVLLCNNSKQGYANGDLGWVESLGYDYIQVRLKRTNQLVSINYIEVTNEIDSGSKVGSINYLPVRVAYAMTVHKCQGLTLDAVQVKVGDSFMSRCHGMLYVALSRCRTPYGLRIIGNREDFIRSAYISPAYKGYLN